MKRIMMFIIAACLAAAAIAYPIYRNSVLSHDTAVKLTVTGMHCAACVVSVRNALKNVPGVTNVRVNAARAEAVVSLRDSGVTVDQLTASIDRAGFGSSLSEIILPESMKKKTAD